MIAPETLVRGEVCGLRVEVVEARNRDLVGIAGEVVDETEKTLRIEAGARVRTVPKRGATFEFALPGGEYVVVEGRRLLSRPARRTETAGDSKWH